MKKLVFVLLILCLLLAVGSAAAEVPQVSCVRQEDSVNGGTTYALALRASVPFAQDTAVTVVCAETGWPYTAVFPAGEYTAYAYIPLDRVTSRTTLHFSVAAGEGYAPAGGRLTLSVYSLPRVEFYLDYNLGFVGQEMSVVVTCRNPSTILDNEGFQLRDQSGRLYQEKKWYDPEGWLTFRFDVTSDMEGGKYFSVWWHGIRLTEIGTGYGSITDQKRRAITTVETDQPYMAITIDCAFYDYATDDILAVLDKYNVKCTFFMAGYFIREYPESALKILAHGHEIGNHSNTHPHMLELESEYYQLNQITKAADAIENLLGVRVRLFRPPYGEYDRTITALARGEGMEIVMWTIDSHDWDENYKYDPDAIIRRVTKDVGPGTIILHHLDGFNTAAILDQVIPYYQNELGLNLVTVTELMALSGRYVPDLRPADTLTVLTPEMY